MRLLFAILSVFLVAQCASSRDRHFRVGESADAFVIIGVAEAANEREPAYTMLWRRLGADGGFTEYHNRTIFEAHTNAGDSLRLPGIPGEFAMARVEPGVYALDGVFAVLREDRLIYFAQGVIEGPDRPAFEVRPGEAVYLGIWEMDTDIANARTRLWRLGEADMEAVVRAADATSGAVRPRETHTRAVPCRPRRLSNMSQRLVC